MRFSFIAGLSLLSVASLPGAVATPNTMDDADHGRGPVRIADRFAIHVSFHDDDTDVIPDIEELPNGGFRKTYTLTHPGASYISVHFANFDLPLNCAMEINDGTGGQKSIMTGRGRQQLGTFWGQHVEGELMQLQLLCKDKKKEPEYWIDDYAAGYPLEDRRRLLRKNDFFPPRELTICASDDKKNAACYKQSQPEIYNQARAVARLIIGELGCTGWLVGNGNMLLTNHHCIGSTSVAQQTDYQFMAESVTCHLEDLSDEMTVFQASSLLKASEEKEYALIQLIGDPVSTYGYFEIENRLPEYGEIIFIPQHANVRDKELAISDTSELGGLCRIKNNQDAGSCNRGNNAVFDVSYTCDTEGGSSGSPVVSVETGKVIALHHCGGGCNGNHGVPMVDFFDEIIEFVDPNYTPPPTGAPTPFLCDKDKVTINLTTDYWPGDTSWELLNGRGEVQASGSGYSRRNTDYEINNCVSADTCTFTIYDSEGDGICCNYGAGSYSVIRDGVSYDGNGAFGSSESITICEEPSAAPTLSLSPSQTLSLSPSQPPSRSYMPTSYVCADDSPFKDNKGKTRTCSWVGKKNLCRLYSDYCPVTCNTCRTPVPSQAPTPIASEEPSAAPTLSLSPSQPPSRSSMPTSYVCADDSSLTDNKGKTRTCSWVGKKNLCRLYSDYCPVTCNTCPTAPPTPCPETNSSALSTKKRSLWKRIEYLQGKLKEANIPFDSNPVPSPTPASPTIDL